MKEEEKHINDIKRESLSAMQFNERAVVFFRTTLISFESLEEIQSDTRLIFNVLYRMGITFSYPFFAASFPQSEQPFFDGTHNASYRSLRRTTRVSR